MLKCLAQYKVQIIMIFLFICKANETIYFMEVNFARASQYVHRPIIRITVLLRSQPCEVPSKCWVFLRELNYLYDSNLNFNRYPNSKCSSAENEDGSKLLNPPTVKFKDQILQVVSLLSVTVFCHGSSEGYISLIYFVYFICSQSST